MRLRDSKMEFNFKKTLIIYPLVFLIFLIIVHFMIGINKPILIFFVVFFIISMLYMKGYYWKLHGGVLAKYIFFCKSSEFNVDEIQQITSVTIQKIGTVTFRLGKGPAEDEYIFLLRDGNEIKSFAHCLNRDGKSIGRYLNEKYKKRLVEKTKYKLNNI
ncbi:hypothetical protein ASD40_35510 [Paenibacillus sp. Root444D2]|nr:hypothetical protein ASD40_35510 [Paenibacillus sp. Root444D2]